jgi:nucleoside-diphosphate-sugar epimerase
MRRADNKLAKKKLGWEPKITLEEWLEKTIAYFRTLK